MRDQRIGRRSGSSRARRRSAEYTALGHAARVLRAKARLSQQEAGDRAGLHRNYVGAIERGEINPSLRVLLRLVRGLGVPLSELINDYEDVRQAMAGGSTVGIARKSSRR